MIKLIISRLTLFITVVASLSLIISPVFGAEEIDNKKNFETKVSKKKNEAKKMKLSTDTVVPININTASVEEIAQALSGIGIKKAKAIVAYREKNGDFTSLDDLIKVKGIGKKIVAMNKDYIIIPKFEDTNK